MDKLVEDLIVEYRETLRELNSFRENEGWDPWPEAPVVEEATRGLTDEEKFKLGR